MSNARVKRKKSQRADLVALEKIRKEARKLADEPLADVEAEDLSEADAQEALEAIAEEVYSEDDKELATKPHLMEVAVVGESVSNQPFGNAQSWDDLAEFREAQNTSEAVRQTELEFRKMVNNILDDEVLELDQKGDMIAVLAEGFPEQVEQTTEDNKGLEDDPGFADRVLAKIGVKAVTKRESGANFAASDFADVPDRTKPSTWKLRLAEGRSGNFTVAQVARAITALQPSGFRGQRVKIGTSKPSVVAKISAAINKASGASVEQKKNLRERLAKVKSSGFIVEKDLQGNYRWFGWVSNKWRDRDTNAHPNGEILAEAAHKEFVEWTWKDTKNNMPQLWLWHTPGTAVKERADWTDYADGFLLVSGHLTEAEAKTFQVLADKHDPGMSHGFLKIGYDAEKGVITKYRTFETSVLPREHVANEWTDFTTLEEKDMFTPERREYLVEALGEEKVAGIEANTKNMSDELKELGVEFKAVEQEQPKEEKRKTGPAISVNINSDDILEKMGLEALSDLLRSQDAAIKELTEKVEELTKSDDEKIAKELTPKAGDLFWLDRPSQSEETVVKDDEEIKKPGNEAHWITESHELPASDGVPK